MAEDLPIKKSKAKDYFNIAQYRSDTWNTLKLAVNHINHDQVDKLEKQEFQTKVLAAFKTLTLIEQYFAYPGISFVKEVEDLYARKEFEGFSFKVSEVVRALVSDSYRSNRGSTETEEKRKKMLKEDEQEQANSKKLF